MGNKQQRIDYILDYLFEKQAASVRELSEQLDVTEMTIRRDLAELNQENKIKFIQGVAINIGNYLDSEYSLDLQENTNTAEKRRIGNVASKLVEQGDTVFMDSGTTVGYILEQLQINLPLTLITNYLRSISIIRKNANWDLIVPGGTLLRESMTLVSAEKQSYFSNVRINKAFMSATGISQKLGVTCPYLDESIIKSAAIESSEKTYLVVDHSKFDKVSIAHVAEAEEFDYVVTDDKVPDKYLSFLRGAGVEVIIA